MKTTIIAIALALAASPALASIEELCNVMSETAVTIKRAVKNGKTQEDVLNVLKKTNSNPHQSQIHMTYYAFNNAWMSDDGLKRNAYLECKLYFAKNPL